MGETVAKPKRVAKAKAEPAAVEIVSIKGFDANMRCRGFQFEAGATYTHTGIVKACNSGFHACPVEHHPLSVFEYYSPAGARYFEVKQGGATSAEGTKLASATLTIGVEIKLHDLVQRAWEWVWSRAIKSDASHVSIDYGAASATGTRGAASATGYQGAASATGDYGAASATGAKSTAMACGYGGKVSGAIGNALFAVERDDNYNIMSVAAGVVGKDGIEPDTFYVAKAGKLVTA